MLSWLRGSLRSYLLTASARRDKGYHPTQKKEESVDHDIVTSLGVNLTDEDKLESQVPMTIEEFVETEKRKKKDALADRIHKQKQAKLPSDSKGMKAIIERERKKKQLEVPPLLILLL